jgi:hypothetical protein
MITAPLPSKQSGPLFSVGKRQEEEQAEQRRYLLSHNTLDQDSDQHQPLDLLNWILPAYADDDEPPPPYREIEEESLATSCVHPPLKKMGVEPPPSFFSGKFFGITDRAGKKKAGRGNKAPGGAGAARKGSGKTPAEAPNDGESGDANPNGGGAGGSGGGGDKDGEDDKKKDEEARKLKEKEEEEKKRKEEGEAEAKREEQRKADEVAREREARGRDDNDEAGFEVHTTGKSRKGKKQEVPSPEEVVIEAVPGNDGVPGGFGDSTDQNPPFGPDPLMGAQEPESEQKLSPRETKEMRRKERERQKKAREDNEPKKSISKRDAVPEAQPKEAPTLAPAPPPREPIGEHKRRVTEEPKDDVDSEKEPDVISQPETVRVPALSSLGVGWGRRLFSSPWGAANTPASNPDNGPGSQTVSKSSVVQEPPAQAPATALKEEAETKRAKRGKPAAQEPHLRIREAAETIAASEPEKEPRLAPVPGRETEIAPVHEPKKEEKEAISPIRGNKKDKDREQEAREAKRLEKDKLRAEREKELELEQQGEKRVRGVKGSKVAARAAVFEAKAAATSPLKKKGKGVMEKSGTKLETEVEPKVEPEPAMESIPDVTVKEVVMEPEPEVVEVAPEPEEPKKEDPFPEPTTLEEEGTYGPGYGKLSHIQYADASSIKYVPTPNEASYAPVPEGPKYAQPKMFEYANPLAWNFAKPRKTREAASAPAPALAPAPSSASVETPAPAEPAAAELALEVVEEAPVEGSLKSPIEEYGGVQIAGAATEVMGAEPEMAPAPTPEEEPTLALAPAPKGREKKPKKDVSVWGTFLGAPKTAKKKAPDVERVRRSSIEVDANGSPIRVVGFRELLKMNKEVGKRQKGARNMPLGEKTQEEAIPEVTPEATQAPPSAPELTVEIPQFEEPEIAPETPAPEMLPIESYLVPPTPMVQTPQFDVGEPSPREGEFPPPAPAPAPRSSKKERKKKKERRHEEEPIEEALVPLEPTTVEPEAEPTVELETKREVAPEPDPEPEPQPTYLSNRERKK